VCCRASAPSSEPWRKAFTLEAQRLSDGAKKSYEEWLKKGGIQAWSSILKNSASKIKQDTIGMVAMGRSGNLKSVQAPPERDGLLKEGARLAITESSAPACSWTMRSAPRTANRTGVEGRHPYLRHAFTVVERCARGCAYEACKAAVGGSYG